MKNHLIGFIFSALLHAGLISGVLALNNQPEKKLIPKDNVALMVKMFQTKVVVQHSTPTIIDHIDTYSNDTASNHSIPSAPIIKKQPPKKEVTLDKKPQAIFIKSISKPKKIKKKTQVKTKVHHIAKVLKKWTKKRVIKRKTKKKKIKKSSKKVIIKKNTKRIIKKKSIHPTTKKVLTERKIVKRKVKRNIKPAKHYAIRKLKPIKQGVIIRKPPVPYRKNLHRKVLKKKHTIVAKRPLKVYPKSYNKARRKPVAKKQVRTRSIKTNIRVNKKHIVVKRKINNRPRNSSVRQYPKKVYSRKVNPKKITSQNIRHSNQSHKIRQQRSSISHPPKKVHSRQVNTQKTVSKNTQQLNQQYKVRLQQIIVSKKSYPRRARRHGQQGKVTLSFSVSHSGTITDIRVLKSSGIPVLDKASIQAIQKSSKILRFFPKMPKKSMKLSITLNYILNS